MKRDEVKVRDIRGHKLIKDYQLKSGRIIEAGEIVHFDNDTVAELKAKGFIEPDKKEVQKISKKHKVENNG